MGAPRSSRLRLRRGSGDFDQGQQSLGELTFVGQPDGSATLGDVLLNALRSTEWRTLRVAVAYAKMSGVRHISGPLQSFARRAGSDCKMIVGIDQQGSSLEAVEELYLILDGAGGELFVLRNPTGSPSPTFHPKVWYFADSRRGKSLVVAGSGNLTEGGLYSNYEVSAISTLDRADAHDDGAINELDSVFLRWTDATGPHILKADVATLQALHDSGELPTEDTIRRATRIGRSASARMAAGGSTRATSGLFRGSAVESAPTPETRAVIPPGPIKRTPAVVAAAPTSPGPRTPHGTVTAPAFVPVHRALIMMVRPQQKTELYLTKGVLDEDPAFFGAPFTGLTTPKKATNAPQPQPDPLPTVSLTAYGPTGPVVEDEPMHALKMWVYSNGPSANDDFRLTLPSQMLHHVPNDAILVMERDPASGGIDYALSFYPPGHPDYGTLLAQCTESIRNSPRRYGWTS